MLLTPQTPITPEMMHDLLATISFDSISQIIGGVLCLIISIIAGILTCSMDDENEAAMFITAVMLFIFSIYLILSGINGLIHPLAYVYSWSK